MQRNWLIQVINYNPECFILNKPTWPCITYFFWTLDCLLSSYKTFQVHISIYVCVLICNMAWQLTFKSFQIYNGRRSNWPLHNHMYTLALIIFLIFFFTQFFPKWVLIMCTELRRFEVIVYVSSTSLCTPVRNQNIPSLHIILKFLFLKFHHPIYQDILNEKYKY